MLSRQKKRQIERLYFIEFMLLFTGRLQRTDLCERFGISNPAATKDLSLFSELNPSFAVYDIKQKCYRYGAGVETILPHSVEKSFYALSGHLPISINFSESPMISSSVGQSIKRRVDINVAASIARCICQNKKMTAWYRSMRDGERERSISPLAIINDGLRWHIRGYDHEHEKYKDYTLARFRLAEEHGHSDASLDDDDGWTTDVELHLEVHPGAKHPETVALDYDTEDGVKVVRMKSCMVGYFLRRWPIDFSQGAIENPDEKHLYLKNRNDLLKAGVSEWALGG